MSTFEDAKRDADELREAARALAYATRSIKDPADTYDVLGSLQHALIGVHQSLQQLAAWHLRHGQYAATDDGDRTAGHAHAAETAARLTAAAVDVDRATDHVMSAWAENGRIAWQSDRHIEAAPTSSPPSPKRSRHGKQRSLQVPRRRARNRRQGATSPAEAGEGCEKHTYRVTPSRPAGRFPSSCHRLTPIRPPAGSG